MRYRTRLRKIKIKKFNGSSVLGDKNLKTKIKSYNKEITAKF